MRYGVGLTITIQAGEFFLTCRRRDGVKGDAEEMFLEGVEGVAGLRYEGGGGYTVEFQVQLLGMCVQQIGSRRCANNVRDKDYPRS